MSQVRDIRARINLDGESAFRKALSMSNNSLKAMRSELNTVTSEFNTNDSAVEKATKAQEILRKMQEQSAQKMEALSDAVEYQSKKYLEAQDAANKAAEEYGYTSEQAIAARKAADDAASATDKFSKMLYAAQGEANKLNSELQYVSEHGADAFDDVNDALDDVEDGTGKASDGFTVMKGVAANLYTEGIQLVTDGLHDMYDLLLESDSAVGSFAAKTGTAVSDMGKYTDIINDIYKSGSGESLTNVSDTMAMVVQQFGKLNDADLSDITENTLTLEKYFGYDVQEQLRASKMLVDQFGLSADEAFSMIVQGAQSGLDKNGDLLDTINEYSVQFKDSGYSASDMFNMLSNAAQSGAWSVDKMGDAVKEFHINLSDGTADEALAALGLGVAEASINVEELKDAATACTKSQLNLDSSTTKLKETQVKAYEAEIAYNNALAEYGENSLEAEKAALALESANNDVAQAEQNLIDAQNDVQASQDAYNAVLGDTSYNLDDIKSRLEAGGQTAKDAQSEIITALLNVEDEQKRYQLGQALMGTMWEDLGETGIAALMNVDGKITESTESLENINKIQFDSLETRVQSVGRRFRSEITQPIIEKALPKVETALDYLSKNMDNVIGTVKKVGEAMKIALAVGTVTKFVSASVTGISSVVNTIKAAKDAQLALNAAQKANLFGLLAGLAVGAGIAIYNYAQNIRDSIGPVSLLSDETNTLCKKLQDQRTAWDDAKGSVDESIGNKNTEFSYYQDLKKELDNIVDSSGKIKSGYEDRAKFITEKLGDVTGTEIEIVDDTIQKYDELSQKLDEVLTKKKGEAYASIYADQFSEAVANKDSSLNDLMDAQRAYDSFRAKAIYADSGARNLRIGELEKIYSVFEANGGDLNGNDFFKVRDELNQLKQEAEDENALKQALINAEDLYSEYSTTIANYENLQIAISSGTKEELDTAMYYLEHHFATAETATSGYLQRQSYRIYNELSNAKTAVKNGVAGVTQEDVNALQDMNIKSGEEWRKATKNAEESMDKTVAAVAESGGNLWTAMSNFVATGGRNFETFLERFSSRAARSTVQGVEEVGARLETSVVGLGTRIAYQATKGAAMAGTDFINKIHETNMPSAFDSTIVAAEKLRSGVGSLLTAAGYTCGNNFINSVNATNMPSAFDGLLLASKNLAPTLYNDSSYAANMMADGYMLTMEVRRRQLEAATSYTANMITNAFYSALGIASPSKKFAWAAEMSVAGYVNQANDSLSEMEHASVSMAKAAVDPFQGYLFDHSVSPDLYANAAVDIADHISSRRQINGAYNQTVNVSVNLNGLSISNVNNEEDVRKFMQRIASETQKAVFVTGGSAK